MRDWEGLSKKQHDTQLQLGVLNPLVTIDSTSTVKKEVYDERSITEGLLGTDSYKIYMKF